MIVPYPSLRARSANAKCHESHTRRVLCHRARELPVLLKRPKCAVRTIVADPVPGTRESKVSPPDETMRRAGPHQTAILEFE
jgi:hypothetical protein